ncbi:MAG: YdgA family protein, partial [Treponema sp.]|nr:YdgA family protein [Treponema sp.]
MKKSVMAIGLIVLAVSGVFAQVSVAGQTYYYRYVETVNTDTGVRSKNSRIVYSVEFFYITFTRNSCYLSDEKGIQVSDVFNNRIFSYREERENMYVFTWYGKILGENSQYTFN